MQYKDLLALPFYKNLLRTCLYRLREKLMKGGYRQCGLGILLSICGILLCIPLFAEAVQPAQQDENGSIKASSAQSFSAPAARYRVVIDAPRAIRSLLKAHLDIVRFATRTDMTKGQFDFLVMASTPQIANLLKTQGYFTPEIQVSVQRPNLRGLRDWFLPSEQYSKVVSIRVKPGEPIRVKKVTLSFQGAVLAESLEPYAEEEEEEREMRANTPANKLQQQNREEAVRAAWLLKRGDIFTQRAWDDAKALALKTLQAKRYLNAKMVASQALIDVKKHRAYLELTLDSGPPFVLGPLEFTDLKRYPGQIIHNVNPLRVGEYYSAERVLELQRRIQNTPYFANVVVDVHAPSEDVPHPLDTLVKDASEEPSSLKQEAISSDTVIPSAHNVSTQKQEETVPRVAPVRVKVTEYPYHALSFGVGYISDQGPHAQGQYSYNNMFNRAWVLETQGQWNPEQQSGGFQLSTPPDAQAYVYSVLGNYTHSNVENTDIRSVHTGVQRVRLQSRYEYTYSLLFYGDRLQDDNASSSWSRALVPGWSWLRRDVDDLLFPREGSLLLFAANGAIKGILTHESFGRAYFSGRQYVPLGSNDIGVFRVELGGVLTSGSTVKIPASLLFRAGGSNSIRGYSYQSIGNHVGDSVVPVKYLAVGSLEYQHWFNHDWGAAVFYDAGTAADTWAERTLYQGAGLGVRWRSPVGPINFDVAYGLRNHSIRPYITLGIAF
jgi:translocation and assembly module TamA